MLIAFVWFMIAVLIGACVFFGSGLVAAAIAGGGVRDRIGRWYIQMGQAAYRNSALVVRETGSLSLVTVSFDPKFGGDRSVIDGVRGHWNDPMEVKSTLAGKEFGIGLESASCYVSPLAAEIGAEGERRLENGWLGPQTDENGQESVVLDYSIPRNPQLMDLRKAGKFLKGSCKRRWGSLSNKWAELSQEKFHDNFSVGQSLLWIGSFAAGVGLAFLVMRYSPENGGGGAQVPIMLGLLALVPASADELVDALTSTRAQLLYLASGALVLAMALVAVAWSLYGILSGIAVIVGLLVGLSAPWIYVRVMFTPFLKGAFGASFFILGQLTFGAGALVRREDGGYEWGRLREDSAGMFMQLQNGRVVYIDGDRADLPTVAWAPLAVVEEKTEARMSELTVDGEFRTLRPDPASDQGGQVRTPKALADGGGQGWHLDASKLERWSRGTAGSELARNGRRKALEEKGGQQRISQLVTMIGAGVLAIVGFAMTAGVMML